MHHIATLFPQLGAQVTHQTCDLMLISFALNFNDGNVQMGD